MLAQSCIWFAYDKNDMCQIALFFIDYDSLRDVWMRKNPEKIDNIDKEKYEINSLQSCYDFICKEIFVVRLSKKQYKSTVQSQFLY